jgi:hypothetical protein
MRSRVAQWCRGPGPVAVSHRVIGLGQVEIWVVRCLIHSFALGRFVSGLKEVCVAFGDHRCWFIGYLILAFPGVAVRG